MKVRWLIFILFPVIIFSQKKASQSFTFTESEIEIDAVGLDDLVIENSATNQLEIYLADENSDAHDIMVTHENNTVKIKFNYALPTQEEAVFRKYITKRLHRASVIVKVPKNKSLSIFGRTIGITSKSYLGNLAIFIDKGNLNLGTVYGNTNISLFSGNIKATVLDKNIAVKTNNGGILINNKVFKKEYTMNSSSVFIFSLNTIHANVALTTQKKQ